MKFKFKNGTLGSGSNENIKYIIEGDSTGIIIDSKGGELIIKDKNGDVIIDLGDDGVGRSWGGGDSWGAGRSSARSFERFPLMELEKMRGLWDVDQVIKLQNDIKRIKEIEPMISGDIHYKLDEHRVKTQSLAKDQQLQHKKMMQERRNDHFNRVDDHGKVDEIILNQMIDDQIIRSGEPYKFRITEKELRINGKKQSQERFEKYLNLLEDKTGLKLKYKSLYEFSGNGKKD